MRGLLRTSGWIYQLSPKITTIGQTGCDIIIDNKTLDTQHAIITYDSEAECFMLRDLNTKYGLFVNELHIRNGEIRLTEGDKIRFADSATIYEFRISEECGNFSHQTTESPFCTHGGGRGFIEPVCTQTALPPLTPSVKKSRQFVSNPQCVKPPVEATPGKSSTESSFRKLCHPSSKPSYPPSESPRQLTRPQTTSRLSWTQFDFPSCGADDSRHIQQIERPNSMASSLPNPCDESKVFPPVDIERDQRYPHCGSPYENHPIIHSSSSSSVPPKSRRFSPSQVSPYLGPINPVFSTSAEVCSATSLSPARSFNSAQAITTVAATAAVSNNAFYEDQTIILERLARERKVLSGLVDQLQREAVVKETSIKRLGEDIHDLNQDIKQKDALIIQLQAKCSQLDKLSKREFDRVALEKEIHTREKRCSAAEQKCQSLGEELKAARSEVEETQEELKRKSNSIETLEERLKTMAEHVDDLEESERNSRKEKTEVEGQLEGFRDRLRQILFGQGSNNDSLAEATLTLSPTEVGDQTSTNLEDEQLRETIDEKILNTVRQLMKDVSGLHADVKVLRQEKASLEKTREDLQNEASTWASIVENLLKQECDVHWIPSSKLGHALNFVQSLADRNHVCAPLSSTQSCLTLILELWIAERERMKEAFANGLASIKAVGLEDPEFSPLDLTENELVVINQISALNVHALTTVLKLRKDLQIAEQEHKDELRRVTEEMEKRIGAASQACSEWETKMHNSIDEVTKTEQERSKKALAVKQAIIEQLEQNLEELNQHLKQRTEEFDMKAAEMSNQVKSLTVSLQNHVNALEKVKLEHEAELEEVRSKVETACEVKWQAEVEAHREQVRQHARTICVMEERLAQLAKDAKDAHAEVNRLRALQRDLFSPEPRRRKSSSEVCDSMVQVCFNSSIVDAAPADCSPVENACGPTLLHQQDQSFCALRTNHANGARKLQSEVRPPSCVGDETVKTTPTCDLSQQLADAKVEISQLNSLIENMKTNLLEKEKVVAMATSAAQEARDLLQEERGKVATLQAELSRSREAQLQHLQQQQQQPLDAGVSPLALEMATIGATCRSERHEKIISQQRIALSELRQRLQKTLGRGELKSEKAESDAANEAYRKELLCLRRQVNELRAQLRISQVLPAGLLASDGTDNLSLPDQPHPPPRKNLTFARDVVLRPPSQNPSLRDAIESLIVSEESYTELALMLERMLALDNWPSRRLSAGLLPAERQTLREDRRKFTAAAAEKFALLKEELKRNAELIRTYETELVKLRQLEELTAQRSTELMETAHQLRVKQSELGVLRENLAQTQQELFTERSRNQVLKPNRKTMPPGQKVSPTLYSTGRDKGQAVSSGP
uniref:FHA domain-containing protein n=3 Tax=Schistocephalus solidus TaxID=70667 RepID=A0A0X3P236_SCHSO